MGLGLGDHDVRLTAFELVLEHIPDDLELLLIGHARLVGHDDAATCRDHRLAHQLLPGAVVALLLLVPRKQQPRLVIALEVAARHFQDRQQILGIGVADGALKLRNIHLEVIQPVALRRRVRNQPANVSLRALEALYLKDEYRHFLATALIALQPPRPITVQVIDARHQRRLARALRTAHHNDPGISQYLG